MVLKVCAVFIQIRVTFCTIVRLVSHLNISPSFFLYLIVTKFDVGNPLYDTITICIFYHRIFSWIETIAKGHLYILYSTIFNFLFANLRNEDLLIKAKVMMMLVQVVPAWLNVASCQLGY